ncbi:hypothetical protein [Cellulophaga baltica]|uniref:hypothetical protein n=1 Tax=Cellulophaga baltica TaxID=76594 RepID=UPI003F4ADD8C
MNDMYQIIEQSSLHGMPVWVKAFAIALFAFITLLLISMLVLLLLNMTSISVTLGYLYE